VAVEEVGSNGNVVGVDCMLRTRSMERNYSSEMSEKGKRLRR